MDEKYGDHYPSSAAATTRLYLKEQKVDSKIENPFEKEPDRSRRQKLDLYLLKPTQIGQSRWTIWERLCGPVSTRYAICVLIGWSIWGFTLLTCILGGAYLGVAYLLLMPLTGKMVTLLRGGKPRDLLASENPGDQNRLVVVTDSLNGGNWSAYYGPKDPVNALLNRPLLRTDRPAHPNLLRWFIRAFVSLQWILIIASSAFQGWDAAVITIWTATCALFVTYVYSPERAAADWLRYNCGLEVTRIRTAFTTRRPMLSALAYINPDRMMTTWMDPILAKADERTQWENAMFQYMESGETDEKYAKEYWMCMIEEGVEMGKKLETTLKQKQVSHP
ncbi:hypothetical protein NQ176_g3457 [Zarea fungicola]|uniref:Uncharacterized protein n=1 Tax=Zarea fungicola TaxID=93591 RepID=A0ACC1NJH8_9HYPO|nr:hypothetical protein NQ176_g3457 [Lecanicillium fungicola]